MKTKILSFILLCMYASIAMSQEVGDIAPMNEVAYTLLQNREELLVSHKKSSIPRELKKELTKLNGERFRIRNPDQKFWKSDVVRTPFLPNKQLVLIAMSNGHGALVYRQGGRGLQTHCILFELIKGEVVKIEDNYVSNKIETKQQLLEAFGAGDYRFSNLW